MPVASLTRTARGTLAASLLATGLVAAGTSPAAAQDSVTVVDGTGGVSATGAQPGTAAGGAAADVLRVQHSVDRGARVLVVTARFRGGLTSAVGTATRSTVVRLDDTDGTGDYSVVTLTDARRAGGGTSVGGTVVLGNGERGERTCGSLPVRRADGGRTLVARVPLRCFRGDDRAVRSALVSARNVLVQQVGGGRSATLVDTTAQAGPLTL